MSNRDENIEVINLGSLPHLPHPPALPRLFKRKRRLVLRQQLGQPEAMRAPASPKPDGWDMYIPPAMGRLESRIVKDDS